MPRSVERQMSAYTEHWNDISSFRKALIEDGYEVENIMTSPLVLQDGQDWESTLLVIAGVEKAYTPEEIDAILSFQERGGRVLLADDHGHSAPVLKEMLGDVHLNGTTLYSNSYVKNPAFIKVTAMLEKDYTVLLNKPGAFQGHIMGHVFCRTDNRTWMDVNENKDKDVNEVEQSFIIGLRFLSNAFLSDASIFINDMWDKEDNAEFSLALVRYVMPSGLKVIFDESRHVSSSAGQRVQKVIYDTFMFLALENSARVALLVISIVVVMVYLRYVKLPTDWYHRDNLKEPWYLNYNEVKLSPSDNLRIRELVENRIRVSMMLSKEEFASHRKAYIMKGLKDDPELIRFMTTLRIHKKEELEDVLERLAYLMRVDDVTGAVHKDDIRSDVAGGDG